MEEKQMVKLDITFPDGERGTLEGETVIAFATTDNGDAFIGNTFAHGEFGADVILCIIEELDKLFPEAWARCCAIHSMRKIAGLQPGGGEESTDDAEAPQSPVE